MVQCLCNAKIRGVKAIFLSIFLHIFENFFNKSNILFTKQILTDIKMPVLCIS